MNIESLCKHWNQVGQYFCPNSVTHWFVGTWVGPAKRFDIPKFVGFCDEHATRWPEHGNWDWKPITVEEIEIYKIMES
jgi:hypothetical protein